MKIVYENRVIAKVENGIFENLIIRDNKKIINSTKLLSQEI